MNVSFSSDRGLSNLDLDSIYSEAARQLEILQQTGALESAQSHIRAIRSHPHSTLGLVGAAIDQESEWAAMFWQELAITAVVDKRTFTHALGVTHILYRMWNERGATGAYLAQALGNKREALSTGTLYAAALLHDTGKRLIREIVHDARTKRAWAGLANEATGNELFDPGFIRPVEYGGLPDPALDIYLRATGHDPIDIVPLSQAFPSATLAALNRRGIPACLTFRQAIELHQTGTAILLGHHPNMRQVAEIAAWHHPSRTQPIGAEIYPVAVSALRIAIMQCLHLADTFEALLSGFRTYKGRFELYTALQIIIHETERCAIDPGLTRAFVTDQLSHSAMASRSIPVDGPPKQAQQAVEQFCFS